MAKPACEAELASNLTKLWKHGSDRKVLETCAALLSLKPIVDAEAAGVSPTRAARILLTIVAKDASAKHQQSVRTAGILTGIDPPHTGRGVRGDAGPGAREKSAAEEESVDPRTIRYRAPRYLQTYAEAVLQFATDLARDGKLMENFLHQCGLPNNKVMDLIGQRSGSVSSVTRQASGERQKPIQSMLAHLIVLSGEPRRTLDAAVAVCESQNKAFRTYDLLLALMDMRNGRVSQCFEDVREGLARVVRQQLIAHRDRVASQAGDFASVEWAEWPDIRRAWELASHDDSVITEIHLLLATLEGDSQTKRRLSEFLGSDFAKIREATNRRRRDGPDYLNSPAGSPWRRR